jgi:hypothetical protein
MRKQALGLSYDLPFPFHFFPDLYIFIFKQQSPFQKTPTRHQPENELKINLSSKFDEILAETETEMGILLW